ncbi:MAG: sulfurtransferase TusA family protein [Archaeoglobaceae archaeon]
MKMVVVDARGSYCPGPLMELIKTIKKVPVGEKIELLSSDASSAKDVPEWVKRAGHELVEIKKEDDYWRIVVRKTK